MTPTPASDLRPGDVVMHNDCRIKLREAYRVARVIFLVWGPGQMDRMYVSPDTILNVIGPTHSGGGCF